MKTEKNWNKVTGEDLEGLLHWAGRLMHRTALYASPGAFRRPACLANMSARVRVCVSVPGTWQTTLGFEFGRWLLRPSFFLFLFYNLFLFTSHGTCFLRFYTCSLEVSPRLY